MTATGGSVGDYTTAPGAVYRAHIFTSTGTFDVTDKVGDFGQLIQHQYVVVAGGGGGGNGEAGAGGAGGYRSSVSGEGTGGGGHLLSDKVLTVTDNVVVGGGGIRSIMEQNLILVAVALHHPGSCYWWG